MPASAHGSRPEGCIHNCECSSVHTKSSASNLLQIMTSKIPGISSTTDTSWGPAPNVSIGWFIENIAQYVSFVFLWTSYSS